MTRPTNILCPDILKQLCIATSGVCTSDEAAMHLAIDRAYELSMEMRHHKKKPTNNVINFDVV